MVKSSATSKKNTAAKKAPVLAKESKISDAPMKVASKATSKHDAVVNIEARQS